MEDKTSVQAQMLANRLQKRFRHLKKWALRNGTGAFRLYDRDIPEIPLVFDFYGDCAQELTIGEIQKAAICGALYKRPYEKDPNDEEQWLTAMKDSITNTLLIKPENIFIKYRQKQKGASQYEKMGKARFEKIVSENELSFKVNLSDYLDTGLFIDRRLLRAMIRTEAAGKKVLNLFSYTGSFSVYAAAGGAASTDSVDLSNTYLNWARENFSLNGFSASLLQTWEFLPNTSRKDVEPSVRGARRAQRIFEDENKENISAHKLIRADVLDFLEKAVTARKHWDIIILDPPAFSNSKKMTDSFDLNRDLIELLEKCLKILTPGGKIFLSINLRRGAPMPEELEAELKNTRITDLENLIIDEDFKGKKIPKAFCLELLKK